MSDTSIAENSYSVGHTMDQLEGKYPYPMYDATTYSLAEAKRVAEQYTSAGQCGFVMRSDGAILMPDNSWATEEEVI